jgi:hypothetical protein
LLLDVALFLLAIALALTAVVVGRRRPPSMDPERLFKTCLATLLRGHVEREVSGSSAAKAEGAGGAAADQEAAEAWVEAVRAGLLFHPAWRDAPLKLENPESYQVPVPAIEGERALVESLARLPVGEARFRAFFEGEQRECLLDDPALLGSDYLPEAWLGHGCDWEALAAWTDVVRESLRRKLVDVRLVVLCSADDQDVLSVYARAWEDVARARLEIVPVDAQETTFVGAAAERLLATLEQASARFIFFAAGRTGPFLLSLLASGSELRDRTLTAFFWGSPMRGQPGDAPVGLDEASRKEWLESHFRQEELDVELRRSVPYVFLPSVRAGALPPGSDRIPWRNQLLDEPPTPASGRRPVRVVAMGPLLASPDALPAEVLARGLLLLAAFLLG